MSALPQQVFGLPVSFDTYIRHGWSLVPIPNGTKGPKAIGWNKKENCLTNSAAIPANHGVGLAHAYSGTMALDIDHWDRASQELAKQGISLQALFDAPDAVTINSGMSGHGKLIYAIPPFLGALPSKKLIDLNPDGTKYNYLDFRCATSNGLTVQDILPPSIHPITQQPYQWGGKGNWQRLPFIPTELLTYWQSLLQQDSIKNIPNASHINASWEEIKTAISFINPDIGRDEWVSIGMACHYAGVKTNTETQALAVWDEWSSQGTKYKGQNDIMNCWRSFTANDDGVKLGTLFKIAHDEGYRPPAPDVTALFKDVTPLSPKIVLDSLTTPPPDLNMAWIPPVLARRATELSASICSDPIVSVFAGYSAACAAADARITLELKSGYKVPPVLWFMTIGSPAEKKTPASKPMFEILQVLEKENVPKFAQELLAWEGHESAHAASKKSYNLAAADPTALLNGTLNISALPTVHPLPPKPVPLRLYVEDITSQKLVRMVADRQRGLLCWLDEMKSWSDKLTDRNSGEDRSNWTKSYDAGPHRMDRVGDGKGEGSHLIDTYAVAIYGNIQPTVYKAKLAALSGDGLLQRFIPGTLRPAFTNQVPTDIPDMMTNRCEWEQLIRTIYALPITNYRLTDSAYNAFVEFCTWYREIKEDDRLLGSSDAYMGAYGKIEGTCGRLILMNHLMTNPHDHQVSAETVKTTINMVKYFVVPSIRHAFGEVGGLTADSLEHWVMEHIIQLSSEVQHITLSELRRSAKRRPEIADQPTWKADQAIKDAMMMLEDAQWVTITKNETRSTQWAINPSIATVYPDRRKSIIDAKQRRADLRCQIAGVPRQLVRGFQPDELESGNAA